MATPISMANRKRRAGTVASSGSLNQTLPPAGAPAAPSALPPEFQAMLSQMPQAPQMPEGPGLGRQLGAQLVSSLGAGFTRDARTGSNLLRDFHAGQERQRAEVRKEASRALQRERLIIQAGLEAGDRNKRAKARADAQELDRAQRKLHDEAELDLSKARHDLNVEKEKNVKAENVSQAKLRDAQVQKIELGEQPGEAEGLRGEIAGAAQSASEKEATPEQISKMRQEIIDQIETFFTDPELKAGLYATLEKYFPAVTEEGSNGITTKPESIRAKPQPTNSREKQVQGRTRGIQ